MPNVVARVLCGLWLLVTAMCVQGASAISLDQLGSYVFPSNLTAATNAARLAWVARERGRSNIWIADAPRFNARQLTHYLQDDGQELSSLMLTADGSWAVYVRGGDHGANWQRDVPVDPLSRPRKGAVEIWSVSLADGVPRRLAAADAPSLSPDGRHVLYSQGDGLWRVPIDGSSQPSLVFQARGGVSSPAWSPDGKQLAFVSSRAGHSFIGIYTDAAAPLRWLSPSITRDSAPRWSADGKRIAFLRRPSERAISYPGPDRFWDAQSAYFSDFEPQPWSIWVADVASGTAEQWWASGSTLQDSFMGSWSYFEWAAGDRIVFMSYRDGWRHLYSLTGSRSAPLLLTPGEYSIEEVVPTLDRRHVIFTANTGTDPDDSDRRHLFKVAVDRAVRQTLTSGTGLEWSPIIIDREHVAFVSATAQRPPQPAVTSFDGGTPKMLAQEAQGRFPAAQLVVPRKVTFQAQDGVIVHGQLFIPRVQDAAERQRPAVIYIHGGPGPQQLLGWNPSSYYSNDYAVNQYLVSRGFVVLTVNFRTDESYGHAYNFPPDAGVRGASDYQDIRAAGLFLQSRSEVDGSRIGVYGGSYGGYLTAMALAHDSQIFKVGVAIHGVHDWIEQYDLRNLFAKLPYDDSSDVKRLLDIAWRSSPVSAVANWKSPVLLISGDDDRNVSFEQTLDLARRLDKAGVYYEKMVLPDETHAIHLHDNVLKMNMATVEFLERFLRKAGR